MAGKRVVIWCLGLACLLGLFLLGQCHALIYLVIQTFLPLPVLLVGRRLGFKAVLLLVGATVIVIFALNPGYQTLVENLVFGELLLMGLVLVYFLERPFSPVAAIGWTVGVIILVITIFFLGQALVQGVTPQELWAQKTQETTNTILKVMGSAGINSQSLQLLGVSLIDWQTLIVQLLPALVVINTMLVAWLNVVLARQGGVLLGVGWSEPPLWQWSVPERFIFFFLGAGFLLLVPYKPLRLVSLNLLLIFAFLYFFQGVAVIAALFERFHLPRVLRLVGYLFMFLNPLFLLVVILGIMDLWLDFRHLQQAPES